MFSHDLLEGIHRGGYGMSAIVVLNRHIHYLEAFPQILHEEVGQILISLRVCMEETVPSLEDAVGASEMVLC